MTDPEKNSVRVLAERNHLSMQRVDAILRLKGLEEHWKQVRAGPPWFIRSIRGGGYMMSIYRLVLKTPTWLQIVKCMAF